MKTKEEIKRELPQKINEAVKDYILKLTVPLKPEAQEKKAAGLITTSGAG